ncbi:MAG: hypothetical protein HGA82_01320 [Anaerolineales bacterium]|nr:hypothetical protein [Anaerolineales bacterium]
MRLFKQLVGVFAVLGIAFAALSLFTFDIAKIDWVTFMEIQPSYRPMENPLPVPARSIPITGRFPCMRFASTFGYPAQTGWFHRNCPFGILVQR